MPTNRSSYFHVGMVVPELERAMDELHALLGLSWRPVIDSVTPLHEPGRADRDVRVRFAYSVEEPYLEVIEAVPDSPWVLSEGSNLHHIGFWTEDLAGDSERLATGCPLEVCMRGGDGRPAGFSYHRGLGIRIELNDIAGKPFIFG